ncbi:hypothetical protein D3C75_482470 [compost metagenome]
MLLHSAALFPAPQSLPHLAALFPAPQWHLLHPAALFPAPQLHLRLAAQCLIQLTPLHPPGLG